MTMALTSGSSVLPPPDFGRIVQQYVPTGAAKAAAPTEHVAAGATGQPCAGIMNKIVVGGFLSASAGGLNAVEMRLWSTYAPEGTAKVGALLPPATPAATVAPARSGGVYLKLQEYRALQDGWLHDRALAPGDEAIKRAENLNALAESGGWPPKDSYVSGDGEVGLVWEHGDGFADVGFWSDGSLVYYARSANGEEVRDDLNPFEVIPECLLKILRSFA